MRTIIVRLFEAAPAAGEVGWHGFVDDVARRTTERFTGADQLMDALERIVAHPADGAAAGGSAPPP